MRKRPVKDLPEEIRRLQARFDDWRKQRRGGERIPGELWSAAVEASLRHGLNRVSKTLGLDYSCLKRRVGKREATNVVLADPMFVELAARKTEEAPTCVVELEKGNGTKLRVSVADATTVDWCRLKEAFLGA